MKRSKRLNTYFRQTSKAFKAARQTKIFSHLNRNLPYNIVKYSTTYLKKNYKMFNKDLKLTQFSEKRKKFIKNKQNV